LLGGVAYWHFIIAEGAYLGVGVVAYLYDRFARRYDDIKGFNPEDEWYFIARPLALAFQATGTEHPLVLDVGTGTGRVPYALLSDPSFSGRIVALDRSLGMLKEAVRKVKAPVHWLWEDASRLPFPDATFDAVYCLEALEFMPKPRETLRELARVLRPGGLLIVSNRVGWLAYLLPGRTFRRSVFSRMLGELGMASYDVRRWQVDYDWAQARKAGDGPGAGQGERPLREYLHCPQCGAADWAVSEKRWLCRGCGAHYAMEDGILLLARPLGPLGSKR
ncbi:MAG: class I SAM-dependent methyltransferase, partial [Anaerolineae bacterium]|nr:class I SAM-dependent methyltransferase [Anaerolineae bacterium]